MARRLHAWFAHYRQSAGTIDSAGGEAANQPMPGNEHLPLHAALEEVHACQQRLARWIHDEIAGNVNALQMLLHFPGADGAPKPQEVLSRLRLSIVQLEDVLGAAVLAHLGFNEAMAQLLRSRGVQTVGTPDLPEQPPAGTAACLYRCAERAVADVSSGQVVCWELERAHGLWRLQLGPLQASTPAEADPRQLSSLWSRDLLEAWVRGQGGELDWAGATPWGTGLRLVIPAP
jgi:hypothetical protein